MGAGLPWHVTLGFGIGEISNATVAAILGFYLNYFLLNVARLPAYMAGTILLIGKVIDAVTDPLCGVLTDKTQTRWGRRRPWLVLGVFPLAAAYIMLWQIPYEVNSSDDDLTGLFVYYLAALIFVNLFLSGVHVPYTALTSELTDDYLVRTRLTSSRFACSFVGTLSVSLLHTLIVEGIDNRAELRSAYTKSSLVMLPFLIITPWITAATCKCPNERGPQPQYSLLKGFKILFKNKPYCLIMGTYLLSLLVVSLTQNNLLLYVECWVRAKNEFKYALIALQVSTLFFTLFWSAMASKIPNKRTLFLGGTGLWILIMIGFFFVMPEQVTLLYIMGAIVGIGVSIAFLLPWSMLPDTIDYGELQTGERCEGLYYGFFVFFMKLALSLGLVLSNLILGMAGYVVPDADVAEPCHLVQPEQVLLALRIMVSLLPVLLLSIAMFLMYWYPISADKHKEILAQLALVRQAKEAEAGDERQRLLEDASESSHRLLEQLSDYNLSTDGVRDAW